MSTPAPVTIPDVIWPDALNTWAAHLHTTDPVNLQHVAADVEYLEPSPVADAMRKAVEQERASRIPTIRDTAGRYGWQETADRINRWSAAGYDGDWWDAEYDLPSPLDADGGAA